MKFAYVLVSMRHKKLKELRFGRNRALSLNFIPTVKSEGCRIVYTFMTRTCAQYLFIIVFIFATLLLRLLTAYN